LTGKYTCARNFHPFFRVLLYIRYFFKLKIFTRQRDFFSGNDAIKRMDTRNAGSNPAGSPYDHAFTLACEVLRKADIEERAGKSGAFFEKEDDGRCLIKLTFLNQYCLIHFPDITVTYQSEGGEVPLWSRLVILHYLIQAQGSPLAGEWISFRQLSGGDMYYPAFDRRSQKPLLDFFAQRDDLFEEAGRALGGTKAPAGDRGVIISALPKVPLAFLFWNGDEEFPPEARILFDASLPAYLPTEDAVVLAQQAAFRLIDRGRELARKQGIINY
jgi:hypothetical protein